MKKINKNYFLFSLLAFLATSCPRTEKGDPIDGAVIDINNKPIDGVKIIYYFFEYGKDSVFTNASGKYYIEKVFPYGYVQAENCGSNEYTYPYGIKGFDLHLTKQGYDTSIIFIVRDSSEVESIRRVYYSNYIKYRDTTFSAEINDFGSIGSVRKIPTFILYKN